MITKRLSLKSIVLEESNLVNFVRFLGEKHESFQKEELFSYIEIGIELKDGTRVDLSTRDANDVQEAFEQVVQEDILSFRNIDIKLYSDELTVHLSTWSISGVIGLRISAQERDGLLVASDKVVKILGWKQGFNHLMHSMLINYFLPYLGVFTMLAILAHRIFPSSNPLPGSIQSLIWVIISICSIGLAFLISMFLEKRYSKVVFAKQSGAMNSGDIKTDWKNVILTAILIPIVLLIIDKAIL